MTMLIVTIPETMKAGDTEPVTINGKACQLEFQGDHVIVNGKKRPIAFVMPSSPEGYATLCCE